MPVADDHEATDRNRIPRFCGGDGFRGAAGISGGTPSSPKPLPGSATRSGNSFHANISDRCLASSGIPIAAQYTVRNASKRLRACAGVASEASSMSLFAPAGSAEGEEPVGRAQEGQSAAVVAVQFSGRDGGEHRVGLLSPAERRQVRKHG